MTHLGSQISALADGRLDPVARDRALCHVAACAACADELAATRAARRALADARTGELPVAPDLASRLIAMGATCGLGDRGTADGPGGQGRRVAGAAPADVPGGGPLLGLRPLLAARPQTWSPEPLERSERAGAFPGLSARSLAAVTLAALVVGLFLLGEERLVVPDSHPAADLALLAAAGPADAQVGLVALAPAVTGAVGSAGAPAGQAAGRPAGDGGWVAEWLATGVPEGYEVIGAYHDAVRTEVDLDGPAGPVVVVRQEGRLSDALLAGVAPTPIGPHEVHVLSDAPWHAVWQVGDDVVGVVAAHRTAAVDAVVTALPARPAGTGLGARMSRGWHALVGAWGP